MNLKELILKGSIQHTILAEGQVVPDKTRCVQCGICTYNCPVGIDIRRHAWLGLPVVDSACLTCGECVSRCPRGVLRFERTMLSSNHAAGLMQAVVAKEEPSSSKVNPSKYAGYAVEPVGE
jgi:heterodisulfide reductase subunit C